MNSTINAFLCERRSGVVLHSLILDELEYYWVFHRFLPHASHLLHRKRAPVAFSFVLKSTFASDTITY